MNKECCNNLSTSTNNGKASMTPSQCKNENCCLEVASNTNTKKPLCNNSTQHVNPFVKYVEDHHLLNKLMHVLTVSGTIFLAVSTFSAPRFIPYMYAIITPILLSLRLVLYWRLKYQYFLLDFCYFGNTFIYIFICAFPDNERVYLVAYAIATGPLLWSMMVFRNSLVFHSLDKVTSLYIHILPPVLLFVIRWYPDETAQLWHSKFFHPKTETYFSATWLIFIPWAFSVLHQIFYGITVYGILRPSDAYLYTFNYMVGDDETTRPYRICNYFGSRFQHAVFGSVWLISILAMLSLNLIWYNYFAGNCAVIVFFILIVTYNGSTYYLDVFGLGSSIISLGSNTIDEEEQKKLPTDNSTWSNCDVNSDGLTVYSTIVKLSPGSNGFPTKPV